MIENCDILLSGIYVGFFLWNSRIELDYVGLPALRLTDF